MKNMQMIVGCRLCNSKDLRELYYFGRVPLANAYPKTQQENEAIYPLTLMSCGECGHIQIAETVSPEVLFSEYSYASSDSPALVAHFQKYALAVSNFVGMPCPRVLEIGCNDGVLLKAFASIGIWNTIGVEPAKNLSMRAAAYSKYVYNEFFDRHLARRIMQNHGVCDIICSNNTFAHIAELHSVVAGIKMLLAPKGIFVFENAYLLDTIKNLYFDQCLPPGQVIFSENGWKNIEEVELGEKVMSHNGKLNKVEKLFKNKYQGKLIEISVFGQSESLLLTPSHPVYVYRNGQNQFVQAKDLITSDVLVRPVFRPSSCPTELSISCRQGNSHKEQEKKFHINDELCRIFGYFVAEGNYFECKKGSAQVTFNFGLSEEERMLAEDCSLCLSKHGCKNRTHLTEFGWHVEVSGYMARLLVREFQSGAVNKSIPSWMFSLKKSFIRSFLLAYIHGDGYIYRNGRYWRASTISKRLAYGITILANRLGYPCSINIGKVLPPKFIANNKRISILKYNPIDILIRLEQKKKIKTWCSKRYQYSRIRKLSHIDYDGYVHNFEVEKAHSYTSLVGAVHNCYHEHLQYYGIKPLISYLRKFGLEIFNVEFNEIQGGSFRIFVKHVENLDIPISSNVFDAVQAEETYGLYNPEKLKEVFKSRLENVREQFTSLIGPLIAQKKTICCYGCPAKFALLSLVLGLSNDIVQYVVDDSPLKQGRFSPWLKIPIVSSEHFKKNPTDYCIISAWNMASGIMSRNAQYAGKFILPLPNPTIV